MRPNDTELLFPDRLIPALGNLRALPWQTLVQRVAADRREQTAFVLMMVRLNGCASCNADSYRAMQGCLACSQQTLKRFRGSDEDLLRLFEAACRDVETHLAHKPSSSLALEARTLEMDPS